MTIKCDVLVVGGGPAGVSSAFFSKYLDKENQKKVILLERLPNNKYDLYHDICGCCISNKAFEEISPIKPQHVIEKINTVKEYVVDDFIWEYKTDGLIINRPKFFKYVIDEFQKIGGIYLNDRVKSTSQGKNVIKIQTDGKQSIQARYLIAADGANSIVRKYLKIKDPYKTIVNQYIIDEAPEHGVLKFYYDEKYNGDYNYVFPNGNTIRVGFPAIKGKKFKVDGKILKKQSRVIGCGGVSNYYKDKILLVGDAAGQTNVLSKGGIRPGMYAGKKAAEAIILDNNPKKYEEDWRKSGFYNEKMMNVFQKIQKMNNKQIMEHYDPFKGNKKIRGFIKTLVFKKYRKYDEIYDAYRNLEKYGW